MPEKQTKTEYAFLLTNVRNMLFFMPSLHQNLLTYFRKLSIIILLERSNELSEKEIIPLFLVKKHSF